MYSMFLANIVVLERFGNVSFVKSVFNLHDYEHVRGSF